MPSIRLYSTGCANHVISQLDSLAKRASANPHQVVDRNLYKMICDPIFLEIAYNKIKSKPGNMTPGGLIVNETLDGISFQNICLLSEQLKTESFMFKPGRRINIPKHSGGTRPIAPPRDKIIQEAMRIILNAIYEPVFKDSSHGFRPKRGCHTALKHIFLKFKPVTWVIEGDISKCFDSIDHRRLMSLIENKIQDRQFTKLVAKSLKSGYFEFRCNSASHNIVGTPQGSIISPILSNIYLHEADVYIESLAQEYKRGERARNTKEYENIRTLIRKYKRIGDMSALKLQYKLSQRVAVIDYQDPSYKRLLYVRYADDWMIGVRGSYADTKSILAKVTAFYSGIGLTVNIEKTKITNLNSDKAVFLGANVFRSHHVKYNNKGRS